VAESAPPSADLRARIMAAVRAEPVPPRAVGLRRAAWLLAGALVFSTGLSIAIGMPGLRGRPLAYVGSLALAWLLVGAAATWSGVARGGSMLGRGVGWSVAVAALTPVALLATSLALGMAWPQTWKDDAGGPAHLLCLVGTTAFAFGPLAVFFAVRRSTDPVAPRLTGAAIAAAAGAWGALGIEVHCRYTSPWHVVVGHVLPVALLAVAGMAVGSRLVAVRAQSR
jgi:hypothetical protein